MPASTDLLIIGAGPAGLAAALFLAERGHVPRIVERNTTIRPFSKAFGVNARTLALLEPSGVTAQFLAHGRRMHNLHLRRSGRTLATLHLDAVATTHPFMCVQGQADSERILEEAVTARGLIVERGVEVTELVRDSDGAAVTLTGPGGDTTVRAGTVLAADGASSTIRKSLGLAFDGVHYPEPWHLWDVELDVALDPDDGHIFLLDGGGMFVVRLAGNVWRVLGSGPRLLDALPDARIGRVVWESEFRIANRVAERFSVGPVHLAGDAAHIHAGIGARGMNLAIEDAWVFAELYDRRALHRYDVVRRPIVHRLVRQISAMMRVPRAGTVPGRVVRAMPWLVPIMVGALRSRIQPWILGLDHDVVT